MASRVRSYDSSEGGGDTVVRNLSLIFPDSCAISCSTCGGLSGMRWFSTNPIPRRLARNAIGKLETGGEGNEDNLQRYQERLADATLFEQGTGTRRELKLEADFSPRKT